MAAEVVGGFPGGLRPARKDYPWDEWLDGRVWALRRGEDFEVDRRSMCSALYQAASRDGKHVRTRWVDPTLYIQATNGSD